MKQKFRLYRRKNGGRYYLHNELTGKQESLHTSDRMTATRLLHAKNEAAKQPAINLQIAKAYLAATDESFVKRTWREVMVDFVKIKSGSNRTRAERAVMDKAFDSIRDRQLIENPPGTFSACARIQKSFNQQLFAPVSQFYRGHGVAAVAGDAKTPVAGHSLQGKTGGDPGRT